MDVRSRLNRLRDDTMSRDGQPTRFCLLICFSKDDHKKTEEVMSDIAFPEPVILQLPGIGERKVATSFEAIECLDREWPDWARGRSWRNALIACNDALEGWRDPKVARRRFVKAATRAALMPSRRARMSRLESFDGSAGYAGAAAGVQ